MKKTSSLLSIFFLITAILFFAGCSDDKESNDVTKITLSDYRIELAVSETFVLKATVIPDNAENKTVIWNSENTTIATIDNYGKVTAIKPGETSITAKAGSKTTTCRVIVTGNGNEDPQNVDLTNVYVAGTINNVATVWKDGAFLYTLPDGQYANSIYVAEDDVFVAGTSLDGKAKVWKNGSLLYNLPNGTSALSIYIIDSDVYSVGIGTNNATSPPKQIGKVWKNNVLMYNLGFNARSIYVKENDIYVSGSEIDGTKHEGTIWKNGLPLYKFPKNQNGNDSPAFHIVGTDVYAASNDNVERKIDVWKNGALLYKLNNASLHGASGSSDIHLFQLLTVIDNDIYILGNAGTIWKNNTVLYNRLQGLTSIYTKGTDLYVSGSLNGLPTIWKNDISVTLPGGKGMARSIFIK